MEKKPVIRKYIRFHGWVQGVGFRYRAIRAAQHYGATGWVMNEYNGTVSMEIQGTESQIDRVIQAIQQGKWIKIEKMDVKIIPVDESEYTFGTRW